MDLHNRKIIRKNSKTFALASLFFPRSTQLDIYVLYAFCRLCDDTIDNIDGSNAISKNVAFAHLREQTLGAGVVVDDAFLGIRKLVNESPDCKVYVHEFFSGLQMDLENFDYHDQSDLALYCFRVAGVIGLLICPYVKVFNPKAYQHAVSLGMAMQITNICRDIKEDARLGRVYIPKDIATLSSQKLAIEPELAHDAVVKLLGMASEMYRFGRSGLKFLPARSALAISIASRLYERIGILLLERAKLNRLFAYNQRTIVSRTDKLWAVTLGFFHAFFSRAGNSKNKSNDCKPPPALLHASPHVWSYCERGREE